MREDDDNFKPGNPDPPSQFNPRTSSVNFSQGLAKKNQRVAPFVVGEGHQKLRARLISHGLPENVINELIEHYNSVSYLKASMIFLQGASTDLIYWVSTGFVDILCPVSDGSHIQTSLLGPGDLFGFVGLPSAKGNQVQAFHARARTQVELGLITRSRVGAVLSKLEPTLLAHIVGELTDAWGWFAHRNAQFLGMNFSERLESVLTDLARKFGVREARGTLLIPEFSHADFAEMIGSSRPMISRLIGEMVARRRLVYDGRHYIVLDRPIKVVD